MTLVPPMMRGSIANGTSSKSVGSISLVVAVRTVYMVTRAYLHACASIDDGARRDVDPPGTDDVCTAPRRNLGSTRGVENVCKLFDPRSG